MVLFVLVVLLMGCGKKGPPQTPLVVGSAQITDVEVARIADRVYIQFTVPSENQDRTAPADLARVDVYALTAQPTPERSRAPFDKDWLEAASLVASIPLRPPLPPETPLPEVGLAVDAGPDARLRNQGDVVIVVERLTPDTLIPVAIGDPDDDEGQADAVQDRPVVAPLVSLPLVAQRAYVVFGVSSRGRNGPPSDPAVLPLANVPGPPSAPAVSYGEAAIQVSWTAPDTARLPVQAEASGDTLASTPIIEGPEPSKYEVYDVSTLTGIDLNMPDPINANPLEGTVLTDTRVTFGATRCYAVRVLNEVDGFQIRSAESPATCVVLTDTFAPAAPAGLIAVADQGVINLVWDANTEEDLAGYLVLRGRASDATRERLTPELILKATYRDTAVEPDKRYRYEVLAVDTARPPNISLPSDSVVEATR